MTDPPSKPNEPERVAFRFAPSSELACNEPCGFDNGELAANREPMCNEPPSGNPLLGRYQGA